MNISINEKIFRSYDIRGLAGADLDFDRVKLIAMGFSTYLQSHGETKVILGRDNRPSGEEYHRAFIQGLVETGCHVIDLGLSLSPMVYFARQYLGVDGACMITASHNPPRYNGFKMCHGLNAIVEEEIQKVKNIILSGKFPRGEGSLESMDIREAYYKAITQRVKLKKRYKIVADCGNATPGMFIPELLERLGCEVVPLFCELDSTFPSHLPDPVAIDFYGPLREKVKETGADFGIMVDGDGDRVGFIDESGQILYGDIILTLLIRDIVPDNPGCRVIIEMKDTQLAYDETLRLGGVPIFWKTGHALLDEKVHEEGAILCGEMSCHYWVCDDYYTYDDSIYALARVLKMLDRRGKSLRELYRELPNLYNTPEYRVAVKTDDQQAFVERLREDLRDKCTRTIEIDGIRGYLGDGWFLIRSSNTQPVISVRAEARSPQGLVEIKEFILEALSRYPQIDFSWDRQYDVV